MSKRSILAAIAMSTGITRLLEMLPPKPGILIINHHRIGDAARTPFDRAVFSASADQLDQQVSYLKRRYHVVGEQDLEDLVTARKPLKGFHVAITFDDGYRDNYTQAFDVLRSHNCPAFFFLVPDYVGTSAIPWWDAVAFLVRNSKKRSLRLPLPEALTVPLDDDRERAIYLVLQHYKRPDNTNGDEFLARLGEEAEVELPTTGRRFLDWDEAAEMQSGGMTIGSHTLTHRILAQLPLSEQEHELSASRALLQEKLGAEISSLAYPVGTAMAFTSNTEDAAERLGYKMCMSFHGGINQPDTLRPTNLLRTILPPELLMFRNQITFFSHLGRLPY